VSSILAVKILSSLTCKFCSFWLVNFCNSVISNVLLDLFVAINDDDDDDEVLLCWCD